MSQVTVDDGTTSVTVDQNATLGLQQGYESAGGSTIYRMLDGTARKQTHWAADKRVITVRGDGFVPPRLHTIDYSLPLTLTLRNPDDLTPDGGPGVSYSVLARTPPTENWNINAARFDWSLVCEEI